MAQENDIVLIYFEDNPTVFARIEDITPDVKKDWYQVRLLFLQIPLQVGTWILRSAYINGEEFTMGGKPMRMEVVVSPEFPETYDEEKQSETNKKSEDSTGAGKVISFSNRKKK